MIGVPMSLLVWFAASRSASSRSVAWAPVGVSALLVVLYALASTVVHGSVLPAITFANLALPVLTLPVAIGLIGSMLQRELGPAALSPWFLGVALGLALVAVVAGTEYASVGRANVLRDHPNLLAHGSVLIGAAVLLGGPNATKVLGWCSAIVIAVLAGSRTAMLAWTVGSLGYLVLGSGRLARPTRRQLPIIVAAFAIVFLITLPRWTSIWYALVPPPNLLVDTEDLTRPTWRSRGLTVTPRGDDAPRQFEVARDGGPSWQRLQQDLWLGPGAVTVTLAGVVTSDGVTTPALSLRAASAEASSEAQGLSVSMRPAEDLSIVVSSGRATQVLSASAVEVDGGTALRATVRVTLPVATQFTFGVSPSFVDGTGAATVHSLMVATRQVERYVPGPSNAWLSGRMAVTQRLVFYRIAASLVRERPWFGWGEVNVRSIMERAEIEIDPRLGGYPLAHAHNALLQIVLTFGLSGLAVLIAVTLLSLPMSATVVIPVLVLATLQTLDFTMLNGDVYWAAALAVAVAGAQRTRTGRRDRRS